MGDKNEKVTNNDNKDASTDAEDDVVLRKISLQNQNSGDKSSKRSNLMNVNVIVLESKYSQIFHSNLSKKIEGISNSNSRPTLEFLVPDPATDDKKSIQSQKNTIGDRLLNKASSFPLTTQATVDSHPSVPKSDSNS